MCNKVNNRIECQDCNYPLTEARYPDDYDLKNGGLSCDASRGRINEHIDYIKGLEGNSQEHPWDCKCLLHR